MGFTGDPTVGGGDIFYDVSVLSFQSFYFATTTLAPGFGRSPGVLPNELESMAFGNFHGLFGSGVVGDRSHISLIWLMAGVYSNCFKYT